MLNGRAVLCLKICVLLQILHGMSNPGYARGSVKGKVTERGSGRPLSGIIISSEHNSIITKSDTAGYFELPGLIGDGMYTLRAAGEGFAVIEKKVTLSDTESDQFVKIEMNELNVIWNDVTVSSGNSDTKITGISAARLDAADMKYTPGTLQDVVRAVQILPGVAQPDPLRNDLLVRGGGPSENLYIVDGFQIPNINHYGSLGATGGPASYINPDYVRDITFSTGGFGAQYGGKMSSVMEISMRNTAGGGRNTKLILAASQVGLSTEGTLSSGADYFLSVRRSYMDLVFKSYGFDYAPRYYDAYGKVNFKLSNDDNVSLLFLGTYDDLAIFKPINSNDSKDYNKDVYSASYQKSYTYGISYSHTFGSGMINLSFNRNYMNFESVPNVVLLNNSHETENILSGKIIYRPTDNDELDFGISGASVLTSYDIRFITTYKTDAVPRKYTTPLGDIILNSGLIQKKASAKAGIYMQYSKKLTERLRTSAGIRCDYYDALIEKPVLSPRFMLQYALSDNTDISYSTGTFYQAPSYIWIAASDINSLKHIKSEQHIFTINYDYSKNSTVRFETFYKKYSDYPVSTIRPYLSMANIGSRFSGKDEGFASFGLETLVSQGSGDTHGGEFTMEKKFPDDGISLLLTSAYCRAYYTALDGIRRPAAADQIWNFRILASVDLGYSWNAAIKFRYSGGAPLTPYNSDGTQNLEDYNTGRYAPNHALDIRINKNWEFGIFNLNTFIDVLNVYNRKNKTYIYWDHEKGRIADNKVIGILPTVGVNIEF